MNVTETEEMRPGDENDVIDEEKTPEDFEAEFEKETGFDPLAKDDGIDELYDPIDTGESLAGTLTPEELDNRIRSDFVKYAAKDFVNALTDLLPKALIPYVVKQSGIDPRKKTAEVTKEERLTLAGVLSGFRIAPKDFRPIDEAIITAGGADVREIDPKTMEFRRFPGLYAAGELLDVNAYTGGYNLQIAFSTAWTAGASAASE